MGLGICLLALPADNPKREEGLVAYWNFDEGKGSIARDCSGKGNDAKIHGAEWAKGIKGNALKFGGFISDYVDCGNGASLDTKTVSIEAWIKRDIIDQRQAIYVDEIPDELDAKHFLWLEIHSSNRLLLLFGDGEKALDKYSTNTIEDTKWHHIVCIRDDANKRVTFFIDGVQDAGGWQNYEGNVISKGSLRMFIGKSNVPNFPCPFFGLIDELRIYNRVLSPEEIIVHYQENKPRVPSEPQKTAEDIEYEKRLNFALSQKRDIWGEELIEKPEGPTYENIKDYLRPLMFVGNYVTTSGVYFLPFGWPNDHLGTSHCALHIADGSEIISEHFTNRKKSTIFYVGKDGNERFGSNLKRLSEPALYQGYYPILVVSYQDEMGIIYHHQSFADYIEETNSLVSFVRIEVEKGKSAEKETMLRIKIGESGLKAQNNRLVKDGKTYLVFEKGAEFREPFLTYKIKLSEKPKAIHIARFNVPAPSIDFIVDEKRFLKEREKVKAKTDKLLDNGTIFEVPEKLVVDAQKNLLFQNLLMTYRYSIGSDYHDAWFPYESGEPIKYLGEFGFLDHYKENLQFLIPLPFRGEDERMMDWGYKLTYSAYYYLLTKDKAFVENNRPYFNDWLEKTYLRMQSDPHHLPGKSPQGDIKEQRYYTYAFTCIWRGLMDMGYVYSKLGYPEAERFIQVADELREAFLREYNKAKVEMADGTIFYPNVLVEDVPQPYDPITATRLGSYWNLIMQGWVLNSRIIDLRSEEMRRIISYILLHGGRLLGLTRFNYYPVDIGSYREGGLPGYKTTGADNVYTSAMIDVLASQDMAEQIVLSFYGKLAHGMTRGTFIAGEGDTIGYYPGEYYRSMYMPPNSTNNALFLKILHDMLIFTYFNQNGEPKELLLAHFTPRHWLEDGKEIRVVNAPTPFGRISFHIKSFISKNAVEADIQLPKSNPDKILLRLRTPNKREIKSVEINGREHKLFSNETIDLSGLKGKLRIKVRY